MNGAVSKIGSKILRYRLTALLLACFCLGGTSQYVWTLKLPLFLISAVFIAQVIASKETEWRNFRTMPYMLGLAWLLIILLYLIPLPPSVWTSLPGRDRVVEGFNLVGVSDLPWMPVSLAPGRTLDAFLAWLPAVAVALVVGLSAKRREIKTARQMIILFACLSAVLGIAQSVLRMRGLFLYDVTNFGGPVGFFSNVNHQGCFLAMIVPLAWQDCRRGVFAQAGAFSLEDVRPKGIIGGLAVIFCAVGVILTASVVAYVLLILGLAGSLWISMRRSNMWWGVGAATLIGILFCIDFFVLGGYSAEAINGLSKNSANSRRVMLETSEMARQAYGWIGIGPSAFQDVYPLFEDRSWIRSVFVNAAHNDYFQTLLEFGLLGLGLMLTGLAWFAKSVFKLFRRGRVNRAPGRGERRAYAIAACLPLLHSFADYPLRTPAVAALFVVCIILMGRFSETSRRGATAHHN